MATFTLTIECDNDAFKQAMTRELARILRDVAAKVERGRTDGKAMDANGNSVGTFSLE